MVLELWSLMSPPDGLHWKALLLMPLKRWLPKNKTTHGWKKALFLIFGVKKFHQYLYGWPALYTDQKPLTTILGKRHSYPSSSLPTALGTPSFSLQLHHQIQANATSWQCWWSIQVATEHSFWPTAPWVERFQQWSDWGISCHNHPNQACYSVLSDFELGASLN